MKKILYTLNPKNYPMALQFFLMTLILFVIFITAEVIAIPHINKRALLSDDTQVMVSDFLSTSSTKSDDDIISFMYENAVYIIKTDLDGNIMATSYNQISIQNSTVTKTLEQIEYEDISDHFKLNIDGKIAYVFVSEKNDSFYIAIVPSVVSANFETSMMTFQVLTIIGILLLFGVLAFFINFRYVEPIKDMTLVTSKMKNLNFGFSVGKYGNRDYDALGDEINSLSKSLQESITNLNRKNDKITRYVKTQEKEYEFKRQLVATISHEIKTPLSVMQATISAILDGIFSPEESVKELHLLSKEIEKTNNMLKEIIDIYKIESSSYELDLKELDLHNLIMSSMYNLSKIAEKYNQNIIYKNDRSVTIEADEKQLLRVISNIMLNAIIYSPKKSDIIINIIPKSTYTIFEIINMGVNIDENEIKRLFEPFYRGDKSRAKKEDHGNGLGLYFVKQVLDKHQFDFGIENIENGVKFYILFPKK